ncbi:hypothetical protein IQ260_07155 [Leptolyngbya cf. ectocarpi LEGE 11479]|uniref:Uncharacterized protein n=1 Tax=Leptolyngbya cf. ectocarpi LEGE 11479 TaxID=1828722 RepID=A0A928WZZ1_LEPEC|nr:hypothetical protein [Leptolyngbya ectocarpi]MBE9066427.1 hypothetical protein [Leptolyngbya cf. ectocarpi LEGE 11479]
MGAFDIATDNIKSTVQDDKTLRNYEKVLAEAGLSKEQIESYTLEQLDQYLETANSIIQAPEALGVAEFSLLGASTKVTVLPLVLSRKKMILDRINLLRSQEKIVSLRDLVNKKVGDDELRLKLVDELQTLEDEAQKLREQSTKVEEALEIEKSKREYEITKMEMLERRSKVFLSFLERESAATITGIILLIMITIAQICALFFNIPPSDILNNAFLLILGYFFGQTTGTATARKN